MDFDMMSVYELSSWTDEISKELESIDTDIQKYSKLRQDTEATIKICDANLDRLEKRKEQLNNRYRCLSLLEEEKYEAIEALDGSDICEED